MNNSGNYLRSRIRHTLFCWWYG